MWSSLRRSSKDVSLRTCSRTVEARRGLNLHEYQSKQLMEQYGLHIQKFKVVTRAQEAAAATRALNVPELVIKAQIHAGGRGKGSFTSGLKGGVHLTKDMSRVEDLVGQMIGSRLTTKQTASEGVEVRKVMIAEALDIQRETYFAILMDRQTGGPVMVGSPKGGVDIEAVAETSPDLIFKEPISLREGMKEEQAIRMATNLGFTGPRLKQAAEQMKRLYQMFLAVDATQVEINPFGETPSGQVVCFDAKINFDENAAFRQKDIFSKVDTTEVDPREQEAHKFELNYIGMDGNIGCMVNGAGLAMATMDMIHLHGGHPANFLDVGGGASETQVKEALRILMNDDRVKVILINIFGGIMKCDTIAQGVISAVREIGMKLPLVMRLQGTNVDKARDLMKQSQLKITFTQDMDEAAQLAVSLLPKQDDTSCSANHGSL